MILPRRNERHLCITNPMHRRDGNHCVFGKVVDGLDVVDKIESVGSQSGATAAPVIVKASGELTE